ncbi:long-chain-fatty-acid--CoA ligase 4-like [Centruroides sculpturatus]|uniref:long-chain-fatty-acid--CoA ligase 4-like n=1 Tax=Centruroides sculpturatus TaxID=218467 RepID=UPI000C6EC20B|nr:long-chain-fatty-acid--CoA ligase 4-like [Centruroides sculpturatus]XP_023240363.1 long-chain-fatty-acid--CoA ligase 4-like [Centruroides sculpturatus]
MNKVAIFLFLSAAKVFIFFLDLLTLPLYLVVQKPWRNWTWKRQQKWAAIVDEQNPRSAYRGLDTSESLHTELCTLDELFRKCVENHGDKKMLGSREILNVERTKREDGKIFKKMILGDYKWLTLREADRRVNDLALGLRKIGLNPGDRVVILAETRIEWLLISHACFRTGIVVATCYTNLGEEGLTYGINQVESPYLITYAELLPTVKKILPKLPSVKCIVYFEDFGVRVSDDIPDVKLYSYSQVESMGRDCDCQLVSPSPEDIAIIMYTSGSTDAPKGVLISHKCFIRSLKTYSNSAKPLLKEDDFFLAYLPMAHIYEQLAENFCLVNKIPIGYSSSLTLTDKSPGLKAGCKGDISLIRPTLLPAVPLMLDRIRKNINEVMNAKGPLTASVFDFCVNYKQFWKKFGFQTPILNRLLFNNIKQLIGGRLEIMSSGGAPLCPDTQDFVETCLDVKICQGYGLTETVGVATLSKVEDYSKGRVGSPIGSCLVRLVDWDEGGYYVTDKPYPRGEIVVGGECLSAGYFKRDELTRESFREEDGIRWFYTGDIAEVHPDGCFKIIDRKKDLVKLQFGEYVSLGKVESRLKTCPLVDNICVFGNGFLDYVVALMVPNRVQLELLAKELGKEGMDILSLCKDKKVIQEATKIVQTHGKNCGLLSREIPKILTLCSEEWLPETGFISGALKVRRKFIQNYYKKALDSMMGDDKNTGNFKSI